MADRTLSLLVKFAALDKLTGPMRRIAGGTDTAKKAIAETRRELGALSAAQRKIADFHGLESKLRTESAALTRAREKVEALRVEIAATDQPTKRLTASLAAAERQADRLAGRTEQQKAALQGLASKLAATGIDATNLGRHEQDLGLRTHEATKRLAEQRAELDRLAGRQRRFENMRQLGGQVTGTSIGIGIAGAAVGAPMVAGVQTAREYGSTLTDVALKANLTAGQTRALGREMMALAPKVAQLPQDLLAGVDALAGLGMSVGDATRAMPAIGRAASAYKADLTDMSKASYAGFDNLKVPIDQAAKQLDVMARAGKAGAFEVKDMAQYFPALTAAASGLGQQGVGAVADLASALQITRKGAGDSASAANNLLNLMNKINTKEATDNFKKFGVDLPAALKRAAAEGKSPVEAIAELTSKTLNGDMSKLSYLFGDAQVQAALRPLIQNIGLYRQIRDEAEKASGEVEKDFGTRAASGELAWKQYGASMEALKNIVGSALLPTVNQLLVKAAGLATRFAAWAEKNPKLASTLITIGAGAAGLMVGIGAIGAVLGPVISGFGILGPHVFKLITPLRYLFAIFQIGIAVVRALTLAMIANPFIALAAGIVVAGVLIYTHWDRIKAIFKICMAWLSARWADFKAFGSHLINGLIEGVTSRLGALKARIMGIGKAAVGWFKGVLGIKSPSRVFMGLGGYMTQGLAIGIDRGARAPIDRIRATAAKAAAAAAIGTAAVPALAAPAAGGGGARGGGSVTIHIHQLPGESAERLADRVAETLDRRRASAARASYSDDA